MSRFDFMRRLFAVKPLTNADTETVSVETSAYGMGSITGAMRLNPDDLVRRKGLAVYAKMRNDEQVKAVCTFKRDAILSRGWTLEYDRDSSLSEAEREKRVVIIKKIIDRMPGSFIDALNGVSTGREFGFSMTEKVYEMVDIDGKSWVGLKSLVSRDPATFEFHTDAHGDLVKCTQVAGGQQIDIDLDKFIYYVHNPEFDRYFGQSELRAAYRSWYIKDQVVIFWANFLERFGGGFLVASLTGDSAPKFGTPAYQALQRALSDARNGAGFISPNGVTMDIKYPATTQAYEQACTWHDLAIARALLVPNLLGVSHTGTTGAFAQSQTQLEAFAWTVTADKTRLESCLTDQLIRDLGERNWGDGEYPRFAFNPVSQEFVRWLVGQWGTLTSQGVVLATEEDEQRLRRMLDMPTRNEDSRLLTEVVAEKNPPPPPPAMPQQQDAQQGGETTMRRRFFEYNEADRKRDENGRWTSDGGGAGEQFSKEEIAAIHEYQSGLMGSEVGGFTNLQGMLRAGKPAYKDAWDAERGVSHVEALKSAFEKSATTEDMTVYRGVRVQKAGDQALLNARPGDVFSDSGVLSTSKSKDIVDRKFSMPLNRSDTIVQMEIKVPAGSKAIDIGKVTGLSHEKEVALAPRTALRIVGRSVRDNIVRIKAEVVSRQRANMRRVKFHGDHDQSDHNPHKDDSDSPAAIALSGREESVLDRYKRNAYYTINDSLRKGDTSNRNTQEDIRLLDGILARSSLAEDATLYRVIDGKRAGDKYLVPGATVVDKAFLSVSGSESAATRAVRDTPGASMKSTTTLEIRTPKGTPAFDMEARGAIKSLIRPLGNEREMLLPRGLSLRVVSVDKEKRHAVVEVVPSNRTSFVCEDRHAFERAVERVNFAVIEKRQDTLAKNLTTDMASVIARATARLLGTDDNLRVLTDNNVEDIAAVELSGVEKGKLKALAQRALNSSWFIGQQMSADELRRLGVETQPRRARMADIRDIAASYFEANGFRMAGNVSDGARAVIQQELQNSVKYGRTPSETRQAIWSRLVAKGFTTRESARTAETDEGVIRALDELWVDDEEQAASYLDTLSRTNLFEAMNEARYAEFTDPEIDGFVVALRYSAVLDSRTTEICSALHDRVFKTGNEIWDDMRPPNHYNCRSVLIPITEVDVQRGDWDGVESDIPSVEPQAGFGKEG